MSFPGWAGLGRIGFVLVGITITLPVSGRSLDQVTDDFATVGDALKRPSVLEPATWLFLTLFAAGLLAVLWRDGPGTGVWALVGFAGVLMQNVTFTWTPLATARDPPSRSSRGARDRSRTRAPPPARGHARPA